MDIIMAIWDEMSYIVILTVLLLIAGAFAGLLKLLDLIDRIKKKIKEAEK